MFKKILEAAATLSVLVAMSAISLFFLEARRTSAQAITTLIAIQKDADNTSQMLTATLYQIGDVSHEAADTIRAEKAYVAQESKQLIYTNAKLNQTLDQIQATVRDSGDAVQAAVAPTAPLLEQAKATLVETQKSVAVLQQTEENASQMLANLQPAATHLSATMVHVDSLTDQADQEVKKLMKPTPWYKRILPDLLTGLKAVAVFY